MQMVCDQNIQDRHDDALGKHESGAMDLRRRRHFTDNVSKHCQIRHVGCATSLSVYDGSAFFTMQHECTKESIQTQPVVVFLDSILACLASLVNLFFSKVQNMSVMCHYEI